MPQHTAEPSKDLEQFRSYLAFQVRKLVDPRLANQLDLSGIVNQTLLEAWKALDRTAGWSDGQKAGWLRTMLANNVRDEIDRAQAACRDARRNQSIEDAVQRSSCRLVNVLAADQSSPSQHLEREERELRLAAAVERLPDDQRLALVLQRWQNWSLAEIGTHLDRSPAAVAGLLHRALQKLREELSDLA